MADFSVVIISYNGKGFLRRCLNAVQKSSFKPKKIIVVDDFSSDGTKELVKKEFNYINFIRNEKNLKFIFIRKLKRIYLTATPIVNSNERCFFVNQNIFFIKNIIFTKRAIRFYSGSAE